MSDLIVTISKHPLTCGSLCSIGIGLLGVILLLLSRIQLQRTKRPLLTLNTDETNNLFGAVIVFMLIGVCGLGFMGLMEHAGK